MYILVFENIIGNLPKILVSVVAHYGVKTYLQLSIPDIQAAIGLQRMLLPYSNHDIILNFLLIFHKK